MRKIREWATGYEPARATALLAALATLAGMFGYGQLVADLSPDVNTVLGGIAAIIVLLAGERTRTKVFPAESVANVLAKQAEHLPDGDGGVPDVELDPEIVTDEEADQLDLASDDSDLDEEVDDGLPDLNPEPGEHRA